MTQTESISDEPRKLELEADDAVDLRRYLAVLVRRRRIILATTVIAVILGLLYIVLSPAVYESEAIIQLSEHSDPLYASPPAAIQVLTSADFLIEVAKTAGIVESPRMLRRLVIVSLIRDARMIRVRVRYWEPNQAGKIAKVIVDRFLVRATSRVAQRERILTDRIAEIERQLGQVDQLLGLSRDALLRLQRGQVAARSSDGFATSFALNAASISQGLRESLQRSRTELRGELLALGFPSLVESPTTDLRPVAPRKVLTLTLAGMLGLIVGGVLAFAAEYLRVTAGAPTSIGPDLVRVDPGGPQA